MAVRQENEPAPAQSRAAVRRPTINDVAALSGVSKSTVSNVLRDTGSMSEATRARVRDAIKALGYRPNAAARNLVQQRTRLIGVVVGDLANAFNAELVKHLELAASERGYITLVCNTDGFPERERRRIETLLEQRVDGIALLQFTGDRAVIGQLLAERVPVVMVSCWAEYADSVAVDDQEGVALAVRHLVGLGHERIAHVTDARIEPITRRTRLDAFERALLLEGLKPRPEWMLTWDEDADAETRERLQSLVSGEEAPTALLAANDFTAIKMMEMLEDMGRQVPRDVSVVGFDGIAVGELSRIALTTVVQPRESLAELGIRMLEERIESGPDAPSRQHRLPARLIVRHSTAPPPKATSRRAPRKRSQ
jgi:DNA-binding LacI/PurR family transcriptional regulator